MNNLEQHTHIRNQDTSQRLIYPLADINLSFFPFCPNTNILPSFSHLTFKNLIDNDVKV